MARHYGAITTVRTAPSNNPQFSRFEDIGNLITLEAEYFMAGRYSSFIGDTTLMKVKIVKQLEGRPKSEFFSNEYMLTGTAVITDAAVETAVRAIATAESRIYPTSVNFLRATIHDQNEDGTNIRGRFRSFPLENNGTFALPAGDAIAADNVVAVFGKVATLGRSGLTFYRHCVTSNEYDEWVTNGTSPARLRTDPDGDEGPLVSFAAQLMAAANTAALRFALPDIATDAVNGPRPVTVIRFEGISINDPVRSKLAAWQKRLSGAQSEISRLGREVARIKNGSWELVNGGGDDIARIYTAAVLLKTAQRIYNQLPADLQTRIKWPASLSDPILVARALLPDIQPLS